MDLYIIRHATAQQLGKKNAFTDKKRVLTTDGRNKMRDGARGLRKLGVELDLVLTSPFARAVETAEIVAASLKLDKKHIRRTENLQPGASASDLFAEIKKHATVESIAIVGHQPDLGELIVKIVQGKKGMSVPLKKGGACCIRVMETVPTIRGSLEWLMTPRQLRLLAGS